MSPTQLLWLECPESELPETLDWLSEPEIAILDTLSRPKRRSDWILGRWTAKQLLARYISEPQPLSSLPILPNADGIPIAYRRGEPLPVALSLSHREGHALAVIAPQQVLLGCDLERNEPRSAAFAQTFFTPSEIEQLDTLNGNKPPGLATLIWSAKESALKLLGVGLRVDTRCVSIRIHDAPSTGSDWRQFSAFLADGRTFDGWWHCDPIWIRTVIASLQSCAPRLQAPIPQTSYQSKKAAS